MTIIWFDSDVDVDISLAIKTNEHRKFNLKNSKTKIVKIFNFSFRKP